MKPDPGSKPKPLYRQVSEAITKDIRERQLAPHTQYLSESEAMQRYGVSRVTIRQAFRLLEHASLLYRAQGKGTFVAPPPVESAKTVAFLASCVVRSGVETIMLRSIEEYFDQRDINLIICNHDDSFTRSERYVKRLVQWGVDGVIYMGVRSSTSYPKNSALIREIMDAGIPCVQIDRYMEDLEGVAPSVRPDNRGGARMLAEHLLALGHKRFAFCGNELSSAVLDRKEGVVDALRAAGLELPAEAQWDFLREKDFRTVALQIATMRRNRPTAVVVVNDDAAFRLIDELRSFDIVVPDDIAVVGFDDYSAYGQPEKGMTTVRVGHWEEGRIAATIMADILAGADPDPAPAIIPVQLVIRHSCGSKIGKDPAKPESAKTRLERIP